MLSLGISPFQLLLYKSTTLTSLIRVFTTFTTVLTSANTSFAVTSSSKNLTSYPALAATDKATLAPAKDNPLASLLFRTSSKTLTAKSTFVLVKYRLTN